MSISGQKDVLKVAEELGYEFATVSNQEISFLMKLLPQTDSHTVRSVVLMSEGDRLAAVWWEEGNESESRFRQLKKNLYRILSSDACEIVDENISQEGYEEIDLLVFTDPKLFEGRLVFARVGSRMLEFHVSESDESAIIEMIWGIAESLPSFSR